jgi:hypothetical protein
MAVGVIISAESLTHSSGDMMGMMEGRQMKNLRLRWVALRAVGEVT